MKIEDEKQSRLAHTVRIVGLALALLWLAGCGGVHGEAGGAADDRGAVQHIRIGFPF
jgi:hypothetical protein